MLKVALIGRPNVGKSTLFNRLAGGRKAIVSSVPGLTRDRHYATVERARKMFLLIDTGGLQGESELNEQIAVQAKYAIDESSLLCFMVSAADGLIPADEVLLQGLRRTNKPIWLIVNKVDGQDERFVGSEFASLGVTDCFYTAAISNRGVPGLLEQMLEQVGETRLEEGGGGIRVAFIGRPNVGKSTLINALLNRKQLLTSPLPGTTRDSIYIPFSYRQRHFTLVDTAGVRRKSKVVIDEERFSVIRSLENIALADVVVLVCDVGEGITDQDCHLIAQTVAQGRTLLIALNKSDLLNDDLKEHLRRTLDMRLRFVDYVKKQCISAQSGVGLAEMMNMVAVLYDRSATRIPTSRCNDLLQQALEKHTPPMVGGRRPALRYMFQEGVHPPSFVIYGRRVDKLPDSYRRYLSSYIRRRLSLDATLIEVEFRLAK